MQSFRSNKALQLILIPQQTPQGTVELKSFREKNQNSDLASILLAWDKERKDYFITTLSSFAYILCGEEGTEAGD